MLVIECILYDTNNVAVLNTSNINLKSKEMTEIIYIFLIIRLMLRRIFLKFRGAEFPLFFSGVKYIHNSIHVIECKRINIKHSNAEKL